jgi:hypothetical protein
VFEFLGDTPYAAWVRESAGWPIALTFHAFGNAVVVGLIFIICLRLIGLFRTIPYTSLSKLIPLIWVGVAVQAASGFTLWVTKPDRYLSAGMFEAKISFVIIGAVLTYYFQETLKSEAAAWQAAGTVSARGTRLVILTALAWASVLTTGRLTAYLGSLYS